MKIQLYIAEGPPISGLDDSIIGWRATWLRPSVLALAAGQTTTSRKDREKGGKFLALVGLAILRRTCMHGCHGYWSYRPMFSKNHCRGAAVSRTMLDDFPISPLRLSRGNTARFCEQVDESDGDGMRIEAIGRRSAQINSLFLFADKVACAADIAPPLARPDQTICQLFACDSDERPAC